MSLLMSAAERRELQTLTGTLSNALEAAKRVLAQQGAFSEAFRHALVMNVGDAAIAPLERLHPASETNLR